MYRVMRARPVDPFQKANVALIWKTAIIDNIGCVSPRSFVFSGCASIEIGRPFIFEGLVIVTCSYCGSDTIS
jgi:hypothetical protein